PLPSFPTRRSSDLEAGERLDALQEIGDLLVRVAIVRVAHLRALAEERVGLVEEEQPILVLGAGEHAREVLLGFADELRDDEREIDAVHVAARLLAQQRRRERPSR